ncbi:hypothetical protein E4U15_000451 [Claviceps sp. LM218 group G6]|nr:hypothetical protein E4U15_000451 [Claviceps sp. LM218 group G6]KAG6113025.1 hypothetical protein E4U14_001857 [Claviceps sp. LM454 group G7]
MAYQPPPGHSSLPPRPPANGNNARSGFKPAFPSASNPPGQAYASAAPSYNTGAPPGYAPGTSNSAQYGQSAYPGYAGGRGAGMSSAGGRGGAGAGYGYYPTTSHSQQSYGPQGYSQAPTSYSSAPQIRNPFPNPAQAPLVNNSVADPNPSDYDADMAAQIANWQSAYSRDPAATGSAAAAVASAPALDQYGRPLPVEMPKQTDPVPTTVVSGQPDKKKTVVRQGGGKKWTDDTLLEWDPAHLRLFVGNLAGETTDDSLLKAFAPWKSVQRAKVIRDKRTNKSKGYGFVSFSDGDDFFNAAKAMNGSYIQSHPVIVKKANTDIKAVNVKEKKKGGGKNNRNHYNKDNKKSGGNQQQQPQQQHQSGAGHGGASAGTYEPSLGPHSNGGVTKPGQKTKNGLRLLG